MSSIPSVSSIIKSLTSIDMYKAQATTPGDSVTTAALARLATSVPVAGATNFAAADPFFIIGDGGTELNVVTSVAGLNITPARPIAIAQAVGARVLEAALFPLGHIGEGSARLTGSSSTTPIPAATSSTPIGFLSVGGALGFALSVLSMDYRSLSLAFGQDELETGTGTSADPFTTVISQNSVGSHGLMCFRAKALRKDGKTVEVDFLDCTVTVSADVNISGKAVNPLAVAGSCTGHIIRIY